MTPKFKTRDVEKSLYTNYLKRAEECYHAVKNSFEAQEWNAATISAIHLIFRAEAEKALKDCERFFEYVKTKLPK